MGPPHSPIFGTYGGHFLWPFRNKVQSNWGAKIGSPQKHKLRPNSGANFWAPLWTPFAYRVMLFQNTLIINPACQVETWEAHMTRPFFQPKSSPISRPMKPRRSQSHIPNCASCCSKSSAADTQWKILDMCVRGCSIASMCFNYTDERRLALGTIWCKVNLYFVRSRFILYRMLCIWHLHVHGDQITMHISMYILCCSGKIVYILLRCQSMCIFGRVRWMALVGSVIFIVRPDGLRVSIGAHWIWTGVEREKLVFDFGNIWVDVFDTYMSMVIGSPCPCKHLMLLLCGDPRNSSRRYRGGGDSETWGLPRFHVSHGNKPDSAFVCESTQLL